MVTLNDIKAVDAFFKTKNIPFVLTGTAALYVHGLLPKGYEVGNIDVLIIVSEETQEYINKELLAVQYMTGCKFSGEYENTCFTFKAGENNVIVNAMLKSFAAEVTFTELLFGAGNTLKLHDVSEILKAKYTLKRAKDYAFNNDLIKTICGYFNEK